MKIMLGKGECNKEDGIWVKNQSHPVSWRSGTALLLWPSWLLGTPSLLTLSSCRSPPRSDAFLLLLGSRIWLCGSQFLLKDDEELYAWGVFSVNVKSFPTHIDKRGRHWVHDSFSVWSHPVFYPFRELIMDRII